MTPRSKRHTQKIYQTINPAYVPNEEIGIDRIYLDIPAADTVMFTGKKAAQRSADKECSKMTRTDILIRFIKRV